MKSTIDLVKDNNTNYRMNIIKYVSFQSRQMNAAYAAVQSTDWKGNAKSPIVISAMLCYNVDSLKRAARES